MMTPLSSWIKLYLITDWSKTCQFVRDNTLSFLLSHSESLVLALAIKDEF
jgi:hypothetical protein